MRLPESLMKEVKGHLSKTNQTLTAFMEQALRMALKQTKESSSEIRKIKLRTFKGRGLRPGVDINDGRGLLDLMDTKS